MTTNDPQPPERRWALAAAICSVAVFGLGIGEIVPLLSLILETRGTDATLTGLNAASAFLGVIVGTLLAPRCVRALGIRIFLLACYDVYIDVLPTLTIFNTYSVMLVLRA